MNENKRIYIVGLVPPCILAEDVKPPEQVTPGPITPASDPPVLLPKAARLVRAPNAAQAIRHVVRGLFKAEVATQTQLVDLLTAGVKVEEAGDSES